VTGLLIEALAAGSLDDPDLVRHSNLAFATVVTLVAIGSTGLVAEALKRNRQTAAASARV